MEYVVIGLAILITVSFFLFSLALFIGKAIKLIDRVIKLRKKEIITDEEKKHRRKVMRRLRRMKKIREEKVRKAKEDAQRAKIPLHLRMSYLWRNSSSDKKVE